MDTVGGQELLVRLSRDGVSPACGLSCELLIGGQGHSEIGQQLGAHESRRVASDWDLRRLPAVMGVHCGLVGFKLSWVLVSWIQVVSGSGVMDANGGGLLLWVCL